MALRRAASLVAALLALGAAGCGGGQRAETSAPAACFDPPATIQRALRQAPGEVRLADGSPLSRCVAAATSDAELQDLGVTFVAVADRLALRARRDPRAALQLGYLVGTFRRAAANGHGAHAELVRRLEMSTGVGGLPPATRSAYERGLEAGSGAA